MDEKNVFQRKIEQINQLLKEFLPEETGDFSVLPAAMNYSVLAGGKRIRPMLLMEVFHLFPQSGNQEAEQTAKVFATALEMIHTYSLVHDDLPAMDNDMLRRGKPTTHAKFGEAIGILAGDALLNEAFILTAKRMEQLAELPEKAAGEDKLAGLVETTNCGDKLAVLSETESVALLKRAVRAQKWMAECAGREGMIAGQIIDLASEGKELNKELQLQMYELKTSRLLEAAFGAGAILGGANAEQEENAILAASALGKAFQLCDDLLDVLGDEAKLGKPIKSDEKNEKSTMLKWMGIKETQETARLFTEEAIERIKGLPGDTSFLVWLSEFLLKRDY